MRNRISMLGILLASAGACYGQSDSTRLQGYGVPVAGKTITLSYNPSRGPLEGQKDLHGVIYLFNNYRWKTDDIQLKEANNRWEATYDIPLNCAFIAIKLVKEENGIITASDNNNDAGYVATTVDTKGARLPGGALAWGIFRKPSLHKAPGDYFNKFGIGDEALEMWVRKEMEIYPDNMPFYFDSYLAMLKLKLGDEFPERAPRNLEKFGRFPGITEAGYIEIMNTYKFQLKNEQKADSIRKVILNKYPKGNTARFLKYSEVNSMPMDEKKLAAIETFLTDFPVGEYRKDSSATQDFIYYNSYRLLATAFIASGQKERLLKHVPDMDFMTLNEIYRYNLDATFTIGKVPVDKIYTYAEMLMPEMVKKHNDLSFAEGNRYTPRQALKVAQAQFDNRLAIHIALLDKMGKYKEALPYLSYLSEKNLYTYATINEARISIYEHTGKKKLVQQALEMSVRSNAATPIILDKLRRSYKGKPDSFNDYLESLKVPEDISKVKNALKSKLIDEKITPFRLMDTNGAMVSSADWSNKIIVLDYWATWCFPCKMAFPGMQLAVDKYKSDPSVDFYFISTMEHSETYKDNVKKYIKSSGYRFNVLYDDDNPATGGHDKVFKSMTPVFQSSAIPRKVVIKNGSIRYTAEGYDGSPSGLADELSYVIELLKAEK